MHIFHVAYSVSANNTYKMTSDQDYHRRLQKSSDTVWLKFYFVRIKTNQFLLLTGFCVKKGYLKDFFANFNFKGTMPNKLRSQKKTS